MAWRWARADHRPTHRSFAIIALAFLVTLMSGGLAMARLYGDIGFTPLMTPTDGPGTAIAVLLLGAGAALLTYRDSLRRRSGIAAVAAGLLIAAVGIGGSRIVTRTREQPLAWTTGQAELTGRVDAAGSAYRLHLSPGGRAFAIQAADRPAARYADDGEEGTYLSRFTIGNPGAARRTTSGLDVAFLDDERVLVLRPLTQSGDSLELSAERARGDDSTRLWRRVIPAYYAPTLAVDRSSGMWRVTGYDVETRNAVASVGRVGGDSIATTRLSGALLGGRPLHTFRDGTSLVATLHGSFGKRQMLLAMLGAYPYRWDVWHVVNGQRRNMGALPGLPECAAASDDHSVLCVARGRSGLSLWRLDDADTTRPTPMGVIPSSFDLLDVAPGGRVTAATRDGRAVAVIDAIAGRATRFSIGGAVRLQSSSQEPSAYIMDVASAPAIVATLVMRGGKSEVAFYRVK